MTDTITTPDTSPAAVPAPGGISYGGHYLTEEQVRKLLEAIHPGRVAVLDGLSHLEAYDVRAHLTRIFGFARWGEKILDLTELYALATQTKNGKDAVKVAYRATVRLSIFSPDGFHLTDFDGAAVGESIMPEFKRGDAYDMALKTACSQALKRAVIDLGDQFGLSLYRNGSKDALVRRVFAGMPSAGAGAVEAPEPAVVPEAVPVGAIAPEELHDAPPSAAQLAERTGERQTRQVPSPQTPTPVAAAVAGKVPSPEVLARRIASQDDLAKLDEMERWLAEHGMLEADTGEYTLGELLRGRRDRLEDAAKTAPPAPASSAPVPSLVTPSPAADPVEACRPGPARNAVLKSLGELGADEDALALTFGRSVGGIATKKLTEYMRALIAARHTAEGAA